MSDPWFPPIPPITPKDRSSPIVPTHDQVRDTRRPTLLPFCVCISRSSFQLSVLYVVGHPLQPFFPPFLPQYSQDEWIDSRLCGRALWSVDYPRHTTDDHPSQTLRHRLA
jgi:hypothetical protein